MIGKQVKAIRGSNKNEVCGILTWVGINWARVVVIGIGEVVVYREGIQVLAN